MIPILTTLSIEIIPFFSFPFVTPQLGPLTWFHRPTVPMWVDVRWTPSSPFVSCVFLYYVLVSKSPSFRSCSRFYPDRCPQSSYHFSSTSCLYHSKSDGPSVKSQQCPWTIHLRPECLLTILFHLSVLLSLNPRTLVQFRFMVSFSLPGPMTLFIPYWILLDPESSSRFKIPGYNMT